ncbi:hypothetical protein O6H91_15G041500 [Diphasiastrum complanatum]|uniref:Uncharacterized protein n=1 Tax=Diphasiastrum complanatum TaxID=34168 RepID=A0ACC2BHL0_DIPCM|nr:hypothetical protein O6H91_15G041500 [Diphasiastrum complanatum]
MREGLLNQPNSARIASSVTDVLTCNMDNKQKMESKGGIQRSALSYLFACFPVTRRKFVQFLSSAILAPHSGANGSERRRRGRSYHSTGRSSIRHSGPIFSKVPAHAGRHSHQEPTSPEVTCVGQVRVREKQYKSCDTAMAHSQRQLKLQNTSIKAKTRPCSFRGPQPSTWRQLLGSTGSVNLQASPTDKRDEIDLRRFSSSCRLSTSELSPSRSISFKTGTVFAQSLLLWQQQDENKQQREDGNKEEMILQLKAQQPRFFESGDSG